MTHRPFELHICYTHPKWVDTPKGRRLRKSFHAYSDGETLIEVNTPYGPVEQTVLGAGEDCGQEATG